MWAGVVQADDEEANSVWAPAIFLRIHLSLWNDIYFGASAFREGEIETRRTVRDGGHEAVHGDGSVEDHLGRHGLLAHKVAA